MSRHVKTPALALTIAMLGAACSDKHGAPKAATKVPHGARDGGRRDAAADGSMPEAPFSFFVTSYAAIQRLAGNQSGFGGDLRYGEADGLAGADKICTEIAEASMQGAGHKGWRAFLSVTKGPDGHPVHAIDRVGEGPWYDRLGRLVATAKQDLVSTRPLGADLAIVNDLPNEDGVPNHAPDGSELDNHDVLTGTNDQGQVYSMDPRSTCQDWTSAVGNDGQPRVGHSWPRSFGPGADGGFPFPFGEGGFPPGPGGGFPFPVGDGGFDFAHVNGENWMSALDEAGCAPGASLVEMGPPNPNNPTAGSGGGYGGIYCFALEP